MTEFPLTALQHGMLLYSLSAPDDGAYVQQKIVTLRHAVDADVLQQALDDLVARQPVLRTTFVLDDPSAPRQRVHPYPYGRARLTLDDWRGDADPTAGCAVSCARTPGGPSPSPRNRRRASRWCVSARPSTGCCGRRTTR